MLNVQALTQTLSAMSLPQLQQYASLHKDDPYVVTMALSIANQKKQAMTAQQGQAGQQPMPKVVDQALAQMAPRAAPMPEDVGIGQLPAQNLAKMAGGGIVAFAGDDGSLVQEELPGWIAALPKDSWLRKYIESRSEGRAPLDISPPKYPTAQPAQPAQPAKMGENLGATDASLGAAGVAAMNAAPPAPSARLPAAPNLPQTRPANVAAAPTAGLPSLINTPEGMQKAMASVQSGVNPQVPTGIAGAIQGVKTAEQELADERVAAIRKEQAERPLAYAEFEQRVKDKESRLTKQEEMQGPMALLQAGFAIMGGTSPFAFANIGAGAQVGLKSYAEGAEKLEAARDKIADSYAKIEEIRRNEKRMDAKELREALADAKKPAIEAQKLTLSALEKDWGLQHQIALKGVDQLMQNQRTIYEQAETTKRTAMTIAGQKEIAAAHAKSPLELYKALGSAEPGSPILKGFELSKQEGQIPRLYTEYTRQASDVLKGDDFKRMYPTFEAYLAGMGGSTGGGFVQPPANAPVLRAPGTR